MQRLVVAASAQEIDPVSHSSSAFPVAKGLLVLVAVGAVTMACSSPAPGSSSASSRAPAVAASNGFTRLTRDVHLLARPELDEGRVDGATPSNGSIYLRPNAAKLAEREARLKAVQDPRSPSYHQWIGPEDYGQRFGASATDIAAMTSYLQAHGLVVDGPSSTRARLAYHGTTAQVEDAFQSEMHHYFVNGTSHVALSRAPSLPNELAAMVVGVHGLHDFHKKPMAKRRERKAVNPAFKDPGTGVFALGPSDFSTLYNTAPLLAAGTDGTGVNIAIVGQTFYTEDDLDTFRQAFAVPNHQHDVLVPNTGKSAVNDMNDEGETELDLEWSAAVAPGANILFVYTGDLVNKFTVDDAAAYVIEAGRNLAPGVGNGGAQIISESYGGCEVGYPADADIDGEIASAANLEGITYLAASGDSGAAGCIDFGIGGLYTGPPASLPGVTAVGGTEFHKSVQIKPYFDTTKKVVLEYPIDSAGNVLESAWNDPDDSEGDSYGSGGGGVSILFPKPYWQQGVSPADHARDVPDISLTASQVQLGYETIEGGDYEPIGGTSAATPSFAGILALVTQAVVSKGGSLGLGNVNPMLYTLAKSAPTAFHDIVEGNNDTPCTHGGSNPDPDCPVSGTYGGFAAGVGYDLATGLGTVDAAKLVAAWSALAPTTTTLAASASTTTVSAPITLTATVAPAGSGALGGKVSFTFETLAGTIGQKYAGDGGGFDSTWILGDVDVAADGKAMLTTEVPAGLYGKAVVVAMYSGDATHLASVSTQLPITVTGSTLAIMPTLVTLAPGENATFTATGGAPPILWTTHAPDTTCVFTPSGAAILESCSQVESKTGTVGFFQAGPQAGAVDVVATDTLGAEATIRVTVTGSPVDGGPFPTFDAGPPGGPGNGAPTTFDASASDGEDASAGTAAADGSVGTSGDDAGTIVTTGDDDTGPQDGSAGTTTTSPAADASAIDSDEGGGSSGCAIAGTPSRGTPSRRDDLSFAALFGLVAAARKRASRRASTKKRARVS